MRGEAARYRGPHRLRYRDGSAGAGCTEERPRHQDLSESERGSDVPETDLQGPPDEGRPGRKGKPLVSSNVSSSWSPT